MSWISAGSFPIEEHQPEQGDIIDGPIDFNQILIENPVATFAVRIAGDSMSGIGIFPNDIAVVNRAREVTNGSIVLALLDNQFTMKRYCKTREGIRLQAANPKYPDISVTEANDFELWGVVTHSIRMLLS
jgi:DNA polymerase V